MKHIADNPYARHGDSDPDVEAIGQIVGPLRDLAADVAALIKTHGLREAVITVDGAEAVAGSIVLKGGTDGALRVSMSGTVGAGSGQPAGTPYYASYTGEFFWQPTPDSPVFVKTGDRVKPGQLVGWATGESKDMSFVLRADTGGVVHLVAPNATKVYNGETLLFTIEEASE